MKVKIKKLHPDAVIPTYAKDGDAGMDLYAVNDSGIEHATDYGTMKINFGISIEIPKGYVGLIFPRSSVYKSTGRLSNCVGVIDSGYRGELSAQFDPSLSAFINHSENLAGYKAEPYEKGDRVAQLIIMPYPQIEFEEVDELSTTDRGEGGFGSTGN